MGKTNIPLQILGQFEKALTNGRAHVKKDKLESSTCHVLIESQQVKSCSKF